MEAVIPYLNISLWTVIFSLSDLKQKKKKESIDIDQMPVMTYVLPWQSPTILQYPYPRQATWFNLYIDICEDCGNNYRQIPSFMILYNWFELFKNTFVSKVTMGFTKVPKVSTGFTEIPQDIYHKKS